MPALYPCQLWGVQSCLQIAFYQNPIYLMSRYLLPASRKWRMVDQTHQSKELMRKERKTSCG